MLQCIDLTCEGATFPIKEEFVATLLKTTGIYVLDNSIKK